MSSSAVPQGRTTTKILLADDSITMHRAVALGLKNSPFEVLTCDNGQDALRLALQHRPAVILADLDMPGLTGIELCQAVKKEASLSHCKVVLLCGSFDQVDEARINSVPSDGRLWKPFESQALLALLQTLLKESQETSSATAGIKALTKPVEKTPLPRDVARELTAETFARAQQPGTPAKKAPPVVPPPVEVPLDMPEDLPRVDPAAATANLWNTDLSEEIAAPTPTWSPEVEPSFEIVRPQIEAEPEERSLGLREVDAEDALPLPENDSGLREVEETLPLSLSEEGDGLVVEEKRWRDDMDFASFREMAVPEAPESPRRPSAPSLVEREVSSSLSEKAAESYGSGFSEAQLRGLIRDEISQAFQGWLKKRLEEKLAQVMAEIERG